MPIRYEGLCILLDLSETTFYGSIESCSEQGIRDFVEDITTHRRKQPGKEHYFDKPVQVRRIGTRDGQDRYQILGNDPRDYELALAHLKTGKLLECQLAEEEYEFPKGLIPLAEIQLTPLEKRIVEVV